MIEESEIFKIAAALPVAARAAYLDTACAGYPEVRTAVEELLRSHEAAGFMETQAAESLSPAIEAELARLRPEEIGERIGNYKLLEQIGEGGFGTVWVAEQDQPVRRRVALKIIKLGMDTKEVIARFEQERQALAMMDHPHIAKVFDAGATQWGRPYFVMELVRGVKITDYCDEAKLPTAERLALFIQVCNAVQHAHQKGIIHRDLKPSNILVTLHEGLPVPKVIDFGIAKATAGRLSDATVYTQLNQFIGTPAYMSPEQAEMTSLDIDTRSDLYSLGVLLYELLVGQTPFDQETLLRAGIDEMRRVIREQEPPKPSTALQTMTADLRTGVALRRQEESTKIAGLLRGDLDWIVMKALEKDRTRRYETANGLAQDIRRHLAHEPVMAAAPSMPYLFRKFARRNKAALGVTVLIAVVLVVATGVSVWQAKLAIAAQNEATTKAAAERAAREESDSITKFLTEVFESPDPSRDGLTITVAETLDRAAQKLESELASQPARRAQLQRTLASTYGALGLARNATPLNEKATEYFRRVSGPEHADTLAAMLALSHSYFDAGRADEALKLAEEVLAVRRKRFGTDHPDTLEAMDVVAVLYSVTGRRDEALRLQEIEVPLSRRLLGPEHHSTIMAMGNLADSYAAKGRQNEAIELREEELRLSRKVLGLEHPETLTAMNNLAVSYSATGRRDAALKLQEEVLMLRRKKQGREHPETLIAMANLATAYRDAGRRDDALKLQEEVVALRPKVSGPQHPDTLLDVKELATYYAVDGRMEQALAMWAESSAGDPKDTALAEKVAVLQAWFRMDTAYAATCRRVLALAADTDDPSTADRAAKGYCVLPSSDPQLLESALQLARRAVERGKEARGLFYYQMVLGMAAYRHGDDDEAGAALSAAEKLSGSNRAVSATARFFHALSLARQGRLAEAGVSFGEATLRMPALPADERNPFRDGTSIDPIVAWLAYKEAKATLPAEIQAQGRNVIIKLAEEALAQSRKQNGPEHKDTMAAAQKLADAFCLAGRTDESLPLLAEISMHEPKDTLLSLKVAALEVWFGKTADYLATAARLIEQAEALPEDGYTAERAAKAWCLRDSSDPALLQRALKLARQAAVREVHQSQRAWYQATLGMAEYRAGNIAAAEKALQEARNP